MVRLGHEGGSFAVGVCHVPNHVLEFLRPVGTLNQGAELGTDFALTCASHFVVEHFNGNAHGFENHDHFGTHVMCGVDRRNGEIATFGAGAMSTVATFELGARVPGSFVFFDGIEAVTGFVAPAHTVKQEELRFGTKVGGIAQAGCLEIGFGTLGNRTRVAVIRLAIAGFDHVTLQEQGGLFKEGVDGCG